MRRQRLGGLVLAMMMAQGCAPCGGAGEPAVVEAAATGAEASAMPGGEGGAATPASGSGDAPVAATAADDAEPSPTPGAEAAAAAPFEPQHMRSSSCAFEVHRMVVASAVEDREPVPIRGDVPATEEPVYVYAQLGNAEGAETTARFEWVHAATDHTHEQTMDVGVSPTWRTWVRHRLLPTRAGTWTVRVFDAGGCQAGAMTFEAVAN